MGSKLFADSRLCCDNTSSRSIGSFLRRHQNQCRGSLRFKQVGYTSGKPRWQVLNTFPGTPVDDVAWKSMFVEFDFLSDLLEKWYNKYAKQEMLSSFLATTDLFEEGLSPKSVGRLLLKHVGQVRNSLRLERVGYTSDGFSRWRVVNIAPGTPDAENRWTQILKEEE